MSSFNQTMLPSLSKLAFKTVSNNACTVLFKSIMMRQQTSVEELASCLSFLIILREAFASMRVGNVMNKKEKPSLLPNRDNMMQLAKRHGRNGFGLETTKIDLSALKAKSAILIVAFCLNPLLKPESKNGFGPGQVSKLVVGSGYEMEQFRKPCNGNGYGLKPYKAVGLLEDSLYATFQYNLISSILRDFFQQSSLLNKEFLMQNPLKHLSGSKKSTILNLNYRELPYEKKEFATISEDVPKPNKKQDSDDVPTCQECREHIRMKKFFDERRFGILEKCRCVICYGCLRNLVGGSNGIVKGPVKCPRCFVESKNVASSARWIQGEEKVQFFKEYCKNLQSTNIKMRLGWTSFPTRKDDLWTRVP